MATQTMPTKREYQLAAEHFRGYFKPFLGGDGMSPLELLAEAITYLGSEDIGLSDEPPDPVMEAHEDALVEFADEYGDIALMRAIGLALSDWT